MIECSYDGRGVFLRLDGSEPGDAVVRALAQWSGLVERVLGGYGDALPVSGDARGIELPGVEGGSAGGGETWFDGSGGSRRVGDGLFFGRTFEAGGRGTAERVGGDLSAQSSVGSERERESERESVGCESSLSNCVPKVGKWRRRNEKKKERRREKEASEVGGNVAKEEVNWRAPRVHVVAKTEAQRTLEAKWVVENKLKMAEATRKLQLLEMQDVSEVAKLQERKVKAAGERALVQIEKSHATLAATGNVPGVVPKGGYCATMVDDPGLSDGSTPSCTISPDSSASMKEFRECQKALADAEVVIEKQRKLIKRREIMDKTTYAQSVAEFTAGSESVMSDGLKCELDRKFGESYEYDGKFDGKHVVRRTFANFEDGVCDGLEEVY